ncbi:MAG: DUF4340 domain-containing protein [Gemmataceae bacterium]
MNFKTTYLLFTLLVALLLVLTLVLINGPSERPGTGNLFPSMFAKDDPVKSKDISKVVLVHRREGEEPEEITFQRVDENSWKITAPREMRADSGRVTGLVDNLISARFSDEEVPGGIRSIKPENAATTVTLEGKDRTWTAHLLNITPGDENALAYASSSDKGSKVAAIKKRDIDSVLEGLNYFRTKELLGESTPEPRSIKVSRGNNKVVEIVKEKDRWKMTQPAYGYVDVSDLLGKFNEMRVEYRGVKESDFVRDNVDPASLAEYSLDQAKGDLLRIETTRGEGDKSSVYSVVVGLAKKVDGDRKYYAAEDRGANRDVVKVSVDAVKPFVDLIEDPGKYRNKGLVLMDSFKQPDALDVTNSYGLIEFRKPDAAKPWEMYRGATPNPVDEAEVRKLMDELGKKDLVTAFVDPARRKELGLEKPDVVVKVWSDSLEKASPEKPAPDKKENKKPAGKPGFKKDAKPLAELRFGNRERDQVAVERVWEGETAIVLVPQAVGDLMRKGPLAYLDRAIPPFNPAITSEQDATRVEITRNGETFEMARATGKDPWKFVKPDALKDRVAGEAAVRDILDELNRLRADEIISEKADAKDLASTYDLAKPPILVKVTLTKDNKPVVHSFALGKEVAGKGVYFKSGEKDTVYLLNPSVLAPLRKELRDTAVFSFDPSKVTAVTLRGWKNVTGSVYTLALEQKDGKWSVKSPAGYNLDEAKLVEFVRELSRLQADRFVASGQGLKLDDGALEVEIASPERNATLTVGNAEGGFLAATNSLLKGDTFLIPKGSFEDVKKAPVYFTKK